MINEDYGVMPVVYFDQCLGTAHFKLWLKYAFSMFLCKKSENGRKRKKAEKTRKSIKN